MAVLQGVSISISVDGAPAESGLRKVDQGLRNLSNQAVRSTNNMRFGFQNLGHQIQDVVVSLEAGQAPFRVLIQQGSQIASAFGPAGIAIGTLGTLAAVAAAAFFGFRSSADTVSDATDAAKDAQDRLSGAFKAQGAELDGLIKKYRELTAAQQDQARLQVAQTAQQTVRDIEDVAESLEGLFGEVEAMRQQFQILQDIDPAQAAGLRDQIEFVQALATEIERLRSGGAPEETARTLVEMIQAADGLGDNMADLAQRLLDTAGAMTDLRETGETAKDVLEQIGSQAILTAEQVGELVDLAAHEADKAFVAVADARKRAADQAAREAKQSAEAQRQFELGKSIKLYQELGRIAEQTLTRAVRSARDEAEARQKITADLELAIEQQALLLRYGGEETEEYRIQVRLLEMKKALGGEITAEQEKMIGVLERQATTIDQGAESARAMQQTFDTPARDVPDQDRAAAILAAVLRGKSATRPSPTGPIV